MTETTPPPGIRPGAGALTRQRPAMPKRLKALEPLFADYGDNVAFNLAAIELDTNRNQPEQGLATGDRMLQLQPGENYPLLGSQSRPAHYATQRYQGRRAGHPTGLAKNQAQ